MAELPLETPVPLDHDCSTFDYGSGPLNTYLVRFAWTNQQASAARTYVAVRGDRVVGYYTLAYGSVELRPLPIESERVWPDIRFPSWCLHVWPSIVRSRAEELDRDC